MTPKIISRFWSKVDKTDTCWNWTAKNGRGYGQLKISGKYESAHRISWKIHNTYIPKGMHVLHKCDNPACVNPEHLFLGTHQDNMDDMKNKGRQANHVGVSNTRAKLNETQVRVIRAYCPVITHKCLSDIFGVSTSTIGMIANRTNWSHVK